jgi:hypothetical protein
MLVLKKHSNALNGVPTMIYTIISLLFAFWLIGLVAHIGGGFIHTLLVLAIVVFVFDMLTGRSTSV